MAAQKKAGSAAKKSGGAGGGAFMAPVQPDDKLAAVVGSEPLPRTEITKRIWDYIRNNNLQDPKDKRTIRADAKLKPIFGGKDKVSMFEMNKHLAAHLK